MQTFTSTAVPSKINLLTDHGGNPDMNGSEETVKFIVLFIVNM